MTGSTWFRYPIIYTLLVTSLLSISFRAQATEDEARLFIQDISDQALSVIRSETTSDGIKEQQLTDLFMSAVDTPWIGRFVMGRSWKGLSAEQQTHYTALFQQFLIRQYVPQFRRYNNNYYSILKVIPEDHNRYTVYSSVSNPDGVSLSINYKLHPMPDGNYKIYDVVAEGVSLLNTHRSEFASIVTHEGSEALINMLEQKVQLAVSEK